MKKKTSKPSLKSKSNKNLFLAIFSIIIVVFFVLFLTLGGLQSPEKAKQRTKAEYKVDGNEFKIDGKLDFFNLKNDTIASVFIEIAEDDYSRERGLMYRHNIPDTVGMLFVFPAEDYRSFWMKNTPSSLDIIYVDSFGKIVRIYESTEPYSEEAIPSGELAQFVVEVKAGFCSVHKIAAGYRIEFVRFK